MGNVEEACEPPLTPPKEGDTVKSPPLEGLGEVTSQKSKNYIMKNKDNHSIPAWNTAKASFYHTSREYQLKLRKNQTPAEKVLWEVVRNKQLGGFKFRRQHIIDVFIVDFVCIKAKLVIEVDGKIHDLQKEYDEERTRYLNDYGFKVIRFKNEEVLNKIDWVKKEIVKALNLP